MAPQPREKKRRNKRKTRTEVSSSSSESSSSETETPKNTKKHQKLSVLSSPATKQQQPPPPSPPAPSSSQSPSSSSPPPPPPTEPTPQHHHFEDFYLRQATREFANDLDNLRSAPDFHADRIPLLIHALKQGTACFSADEQTQVVGAVPGT